MSHCFHSHQLRTVGSRNPPAPRYILSPFLPGSQGGRSHRANPRVTLPCPQALRICVDTQMNCFKRVLMQLFHFPSHSELLMFRNKLLPVLLIYKDKMRMQKTGSVEWYEFPLQLQFISTIWFCAFLIYISPVRAKIGSWGSHCYRPLSSPVSHSAPTVAGHTVDQGSATKSALIKLECPLGHALRDWQGGGCGWASQARDEAREHRPLTSRFFLPTTAMPSELSISSTFVSQT